MNFDWNNPPWKGGVKKYRLGLQPVPLADWFQRPISSELFAHKKRLLDQRYADVVQVYGASGTAQVKLAEHFESAKLDGLDYPDTIAHLSLQVADDLCLVASAGEQRLLAASVCSPSYWNVREKIGQSLAEIHQPVTSLEGKLGERIASSISNAPLLQPFERVNWFVHGDQERFHTTPEENLQGHPSTWFVRSERETICRFSEDYVLFTINVRFAPLSEIAAYPEARMDLKKSLQGFDADEMTYFGGDKKIQRLMSFLAS